MEHSNFDALQRASGTPANIDSHNRMTKLSQLVSDHQATLTAAMYKAHRDLYTFDVDHILNRLRANLYKYEGPSTDEPFVRWARRWVMKEAQRHRITEAILHEHSRIIHGAINDNLWMTSVEDRATQHHDVFWEITNLIFSKAHALNKSGTAKLSTRVYALVKRHCWFYHNTRNQRRLNSLTKHLNQGGELKCEVMSDEELAAERASLLEPDSFAHNATFVT
ncbi:hypothetical protein [Tunturiibacter gelidiferens]|uniref:hypothetical protein n=1 Tax=Tunturiibacter gelidiferens TaxID=3069689 RepID=UPI003D9B71AF